MFLKGNCSKTFAPLVRFVDAKKPVRLQFDSNAIPPKHPEFRQKTVAFSNLLARLRRPAKPQSDIVQHRALASSRRVCQCQFRFC